VTKDGAVTLTFSSAPATPLWLDGKQIDARKDLRMDLARGTHTLVIPLDPASLPDQLILQSPDVVFRPD
jgi:hypothetical protein